MKAIDCPRCQSSMELKELHKKKTFKGVDISYASDSFVCPECALEAGTVHTAGGVQCAIADAYREKVDLLTSREIKSLREAKGLTQQQLADAMNVGIASVKRWETGMIQSKSMDHALRMQLQGNPGSNNYTGNREMDLPRIKLVAVTLEKKLGRRLLKVADKFLFLAKYLWYADMLAFRQLGRGLTGASYAALSAEGSVRLHRFLRLAVGARPAVSQPVLDPSTGQERGRMVLVPVTVGARLRFAEPFVQVVGLDVQLAGSPDATEGPDVLVGALASYGVEVPLGDSPLSFRPMVELGNLGPFFVVRGLAGLSVAFGG